MTKVRDTDGRYVFCKTFPVRMGVLQGDITFPIYFIIDLETILRLYDNTPVKDVSFGGITLHTLGYTEDATLVDRDSTLESKRVSKISQCSAELADMNINIAKTEYIHVKRQQKVGAPDQQTAQNVYKFKCNRPDYGWIFDNKLGLRIHQGKWCQ